MGHFAIATQPNVTDAAYAYIDHLPKGAVYPYAPVQLTPASSGEVDITILELDTSGLAVRAAGSYDLTFSGGEHVTGSFDAPLCSQLECKNDALGRD
jgi:hypothetical protein